MDRNCCEFLLWLDCDGEEVLTVAYSESGMPFVGLSSLSHLPNNCCDGVEEIHLSKRELPQHLSPHIS